MKKLALVLAVIMLLGCMNLTALAEEDPIKESASGFYYIEATDTQAALSAANKDILFQQDGLWFKDLNGNGQLDVYEDWRADINERTADLISQMTMDEKAGTLIFSCVFGSNGTVVSDLGDSGDKSAVSGAFASTSASPYVVDPERALYSHNVFEDIDNSSINPMAFQIQDMNVTTFIAAFTGMAKDQLDCFNAIQAIAEENRLGIPCVFSGDRSYNSWGGMIDMAHYAFGVAHDPELLYNLASEYAKESVAIGYTQTFHGYGNEIGSWYGDDPAELAVMAAIETRAYEDNNFNSHSKHFIARGGRSTYASAKSPADLLDSWMVGWKAVIEAGTQWIMTNNAEARTPGVESYFDKVTYDYLRNELGYDGIVCMDWIVPMYQLMEKTGITADGVDISTLTATERYALILNAGVDMLSAHCTVPGRDLEPYYDSFGGTWPGLITEAVELGLVTEDTINNHVRRVLRNKFDLGLFEDPYSDWEYAAHLIYGENYVAGQEAFVPMTNSEINAIRRPEITAMEEELMVKSTILMKNDDILPLQSGVKLYVTSNSDAVRKEDVDALSAYATIVDEMADADYVFAHVTSLGDATELILDDADDEGKQVIMVMEGTISSEPTTYYLLNTGAFLMQTYNNTPDHGSSVGSYYRYVTPAITAQMIFGEKEPAGSTVFEVAYNSEDKTLSWGELQDDIGVSDEVRLYMAMLAKLNPMVDMPNNLGNVLYTTNYGMNYTDKADIELLLLTAPRSLVTQEVDTGSSVSTQTSVVNTTKAGEPFQVHFVAWNKGEGDGHVTVQVLDGEQVVAEKLVTLDAGQFRVIGMDVVLEAGEHVLTVGDLTTRVTVTD